MIKLSKEKKKKRKINSSYILNSKSTVDKDMPSYANDPTFIERGNASREFLSRVGFPDDEVVRLWKKKYRKEIKELGKKFSGNQKW